MDHVASLVYIGMSSHLNDTACVARSLVFCSFFLSGIVYHWSDISSVTST